jgi:hypothetical protein
VIHCKSGARSAKAIRELEEKFDIKIIQSKAVFRLYGAGAVGTDEEELSDFSDFF